MRLYAPTKIIQDSGGYFIVQKKIIGKRLCDLNDNDVTLKVLSQLLNLVITYTEMLIKFGYYIDIMGPVGYNVHQLNNDTHKRKSLIQKKIYALIYLRDILNSKNIMIDSNGNLFLVDNVGELLKKSLSLRIQHVLFAKLYQIKIRNLIDQK